VLVHVLLAAQAVAADGQPLIAGEDDHRVGRLARLFQGRQDAADLLVHVRDHRVVGGQLLADLVGRARPGEQQLVAPLEVAVVERVLGQEIRREGDLGRVVLVFVERRDQQRIVRGREAHLQKERLPRPAPDDLDRGVGKRAADVGRQSDALVREEPAFVRLKDPAAVAGHGPARVIDALRRLSPAHEQPQAPLEAAALGPALGVPLAHVPGMVPGLAQHARQGHLVGVELRAEIRDPAADAAAPAEDFLAAGHAQRVGREGPREHRPLADQPVQVRRRDDGIAQGLDRVGALVIAQQEEDVRPGGRVRAGVCGSRSAPCGRRQAKQHGTNAPRPQAVHEPRRGPHRGLPITG